MNIAMILAGGSGQRMGSELPKQFIEVWGKPIVAYVLETFQKNPQIDAIELVCIPEYQDRMGEIVRKYEITKVKWIVGAGDTYQGSVLQGLQGLSGNCTNDDIVLIHFGVSPFVTDEEIDDSIRICKKYGNAIASTPCFLCLCEKESKISSTVGLDRDAIMGLNSPQTFRYDFLCKLYEEGRRTGTLDVVEPHTTSLMLAMGKRLYFSKSSQRNIKITTQEDLDLFKGYALLKKHEEDYYD